MSSKWPSAGDGGIERPEVTTASVLISINDLNKLNCSQILGSKGVIGATVAICGNILISLALNCQKLAHRRLDREKALKILERELATRRNSPGLDDNAEEGGSQTTAKLTAQTGLGTGAIETAPLLQHSHSDPSPRKYGTGSNSNSGNDSNATRVIPPLTQSTNKPNSYTIPFPFRIRSQNTSLLTGVREDTAEPSVSHSTHMMLPVEDISDTPSENGRACFQNGSSRTGQTGKDNLVIEQENESDYLKSKLWCVTYISMAAELFLQTHHSPLHSQVVRFPPHEYR